MGGIRVNIVGWRHGETPIEGFDELVEVGGGDFGLGMFGDEAVEAVGGYFGEGRVFGF